jgi:2'-5' RNA ligase
VKDELRKLLSRLGPLAKLQWSAVENLHITTKFIGEWPQEELEKMKRALGAVPAPPPIHVEIRGLGWFPNPRHPRVFWAGVQADESLQALADATENAVAEIGVAKEKRPFSPHLTLARIKEPVPLDSLRKALSGLEEHSFGAFQGRAFYLYLSAGGKYTRLAEFPFAQKT